SKDEISALIESTMQTETVETETFTDLMDATEVIEARASSIGEARALAKEALIRGVEALTLTGEPSPEAVAWLKGLGLKETTVARGVVDCSEQPIFSAYEMTDRAKEAYLASGIFFQR